MGGDGLWVHVAHDGRRVGRCLLFRKDRAITHCIFLGFAAGVMIYVVVEELIPEAHLVEHSNIGTLGVIADFVVMMMLDVALG